MKRILVIKHSALGDIILTLPHLRALRRAHADDHIVLATAAPYGGLMTASRCADEVWVDPRAGLARPLTALQWMRRLRAGRFDRVYDLQGSQRTALYFRALRGQGLEWVGKVPGCSHPHPDPDPPCHITLHRRRQLERVGIHAIDEPDLGFLDGPVGTLGLPPRFTLLVPGSAAHRPEKRWPVERFIGLAEALLARGSVPVIIGTQAEAQVAQALASGCPGSISLVGRTDFGQLAALARLAEGAVGNDTGPMHLFAAAGTPVVALFGPASDPLRMRPWGRRVAVLRAAALADLGPGQALAALARLQGADAVGTPHPNLPSVQDPALAAAPGGAVT